MSFLEVFYPLTENICPLVHWVFTTPFSLVTSIEPKLKTRIIYTLAAIYKEAQISIVCVFNLQFNFYIYIHWHTGTSDKLICS